MSRKKKGTRTAWPSYRIFFIGAATATGQTCFSGLSFQGREGRRQDRRGRDDTAHSFDNFLSDSLEFGDVLNCILGLIIRSNQSVFLLVLFNNNSSSIMGRVPES